MLSLSLVQIALRIALATAIAFVTTPVSLRLLGVRRGVGTALMSGGFGWGAGLLLALGLNEWHWSADDLVLHAVGLAIPLTMAAAVTLDLLARPGTLAVGERAGLLRAPRPVRAVSARLAVARRYRELLHLVRREGFGPFASASGRAARSTNELGVRIRRILESAGGVYVKMGQIAATRVDLLPQAVCDELSSLQNRAAAEPYERILEVVRTELGADLDTVFAEFDPEPLAAGSIGQTHLAVLRSGERVIVKVQRPGVEAAIERDLAALGLLARFAQRRTVVGYDFRVAEMLRQFSVGLRGELDFAKEADSMEEMATLLADTRVRVPKVHRRLCTRRLLVQERFEGCTAADTRALDEMAIDRTALAHELLRSMLHQILRAGLFHADPHPGNVFVFRDGTLGLIDLGAVGRLDAIQKAAITDIMIGLARQDAGRVRDGVERVAELVDASSPEMLERALSRLMADNIRPSGQIDPTVLQELVTTLARYEIRLPTEIVVLSRALITMDGTLRTLAPELSLVEAVISLLTSNEGEPILDPADMLKAELFSALPHLRHVPERLDHLLTQAARGELRIRHVVDEDHRRILRTLVNRALFAAIGAAFLVVSAILLVAADEGPMIGEQTGLFEILGFGGLLAGTVLLLRVVAAVARDGTT